MKCAEFVSLLSAVGTVAAAIFACLSARAAQKSADASSNELIQMKRDSDREVFIRIMELMQCSEARAARERMRDLKDTTHDAWVRGKSKDDLRAMRDAIEDVCWRFDVVGSLYEYVDDDMKKILSEKWSEVAGWYWEKASRFVVDRRNEKPERRNLWRHFEEFPKPDQK